MKSAVGRPVSRDSSAGGPLFSAQQGPRLVVQGWIASRLLILVTSLVLLVQGRSLHRQWQVWDVVHFVRIATDGYAGANEEAFFPGLPILLGLASRLGLPPLIAGVIASAVASAFAAWALYRLGDGGVAGTVAALAWLFAPMAVFTVAPYTESLFCAFAFWSWYRARHGAWGMAAVLAAGACTFRVSGLFLIGALGLLALTAPTTRGWLERFQRIVWLIVPAATMFAYVVYLRIVKGSWTAWLQAQAGGWSRGFHSPIETWRNTVAVAGPGGYPGHPSWGWIFRADIATMLIGCAVVIVCLARRRWGEAGWIGVQLLAFGTSVWYMSASRALLLWFPLWLLIGQGAAHPLTGQRRVLRAVVYGVGGMASAIIMVAWARQFLMGEWAS